LKSRYLLLQPVQVACENLPSTALVAEARLDSAQPLGDRIIFLLKPFEPAINLVEMAKDFAT
jgi:hypothetical protein